MLTGESLKRSFDNASLTGFGFNAVFVFCFSELAKVFEGSAVFVSPDCEAKPVWCPVSVCCESVRLRGGVPGCGSF